VDHDDTTGNRASPRVGLVWQLAPTTTAKALYGSAHRSPNAYEDLPSYAPGPVSLGLHGETIDTLEFDLDQRLGRNLTLRAAAYRWTIHDLIIENDISEDYQNQPPAVSRGIELSADRTWDDGTRLRASTTLQDARYAGAGALPNAPRALAKLDLSGRLPLAALRAGYELRYDGRRDTLAGYAVGGYALSSLYLSADTWFTGLILSLGIANVFDKSYAQPASANNWQDFLEQDRRSVTLRAVYRF
jgi:iron complex outermembrane receptor protein